jgi:RNA polymerase sigma-70 factor (ECF subfamily)
VNDPFTEHRSLLFAVAYRMLGSVAEAEDMVQETYLRWQRQARDAITTPRAWLVAAVTRLCIDELRSARKRREEYVGPWLPEPIVDPAAPAPDASAELADSLGVAFLLMLEQLAPVERAVFLLREAFDYDYAEIARIVDKSEANCRQMMARAKNHLAQGDVTSARPTPQSEEIVRRFTTATATGKLEDLLSVLTEDAVLYTDGGGRVRSALRPIESADHIARFFLGIRERGLAGATVKPVRVNGEPGILMRRTDGVVSVTSFAFSGGRIRTIYTVSNPEKLRHIRFDEL